MVIQTSSMFTCRCLYLSPADTGLEYLFYLSAADQSVARQSTGAEHR